MPCRDSELAVRGLIISSCGTLQIREKREERREKMASNYVDTTGDEGRFHGHHNSTTPTGAAASSPRTMRRSFSSASSGGGGGSPKCVCAPATHAGSFKCRLHRTNSQGHDHPHQSHPTSPAAVSAAPQPSSASSRTVEAQ
ncbi:hypothetical protein GUJ93_ZPchr0002g24384 [Zizania palustris]|uniref:Uncharacterized protein n=1 Tax=Zizania palustris TaxID=103762 RepID=A0A8J5RXY3_ZIZPA|nr:hypothetical protein GUJ93_ZPchr0002g24384 [Zizania palustris]